MLKLVRRIVVDYGRSVEVWYRVPPCPVPDAAHTALVLPDTDFRPVEFGMVVKYTPAKGVCHRRAVRAYLIDPQPGSMPTFAALGQGTDEQPHPAVKNILDSCCMLGRRKPASRRSNCE